MIALLYVLFILSGAAGLFYESVWSRYLSLFVGHGAYAQVIVLVIFLGGMALGAALVSRRSARLRDPLYGYAMIELAIGLVGLVFHDLIYQPVTGWAYDALFPALGGGVMVALAKWTLAGLLILPQSILLGATFPLMSAGIIRRRPDRPGTVLSLLYFTNSLGAAVGVLLAGFYLVRLAGLPGTLLAAAILNLLVGLVALFAAKLRPPEEAAAAAEELPGTAAYQQDAALLAPAPLTRILLFAAWGTAVASFIYEVAWIRLLSLVLGSATHSFELMLSAFILGLALGAFWIRRRMERITRPLTVLAIIQVIMGISAVLSLAAYHESFFWLEDLMAAVGRTDQGYAVFTLARYLVCLAIMLPATFCAGMTLPLITRTLLVSGTGERAIGAVYGWNTFGSIVGVSLASLLLIPWLGLKGALVLGGTLDVVVGLVIMAALLRAGAPVRRLAFQGLALAVLTPALVLMGVRLEHALLTSGVFRTGRVATRGDVRFYRDGRTATVSVSLPRSGRINIATNGKPDGSLDPVWFEACGAADSLRTMTGDDPTQVLLPLVTLAHRPQARSVAVIGHGTGMSTHALLASPTLESAVTIEIEPLMVEASRHFHPVNRRAFDDPRSQYVYDDAKAYFAAANRQFDIIVAEPSNPWVSGVSGLFTTEFYARLRRYLAPGAVLGQWLHTYELTDDLVLTVLGAIHRNFADYRVYAVNTADLLIVAVAEGAVPEPDWGVFQLPEVRKDLCHFHPADASDLDALLLTTREAMAPLLDRSTEVNSDFYPVLDLGAERARFLGRAAMGLSGLHAGIHDFSGRAGGVLRGPPDRTVSGFGTVPRLRALLASADLRRGGTATAPDSVWHASRLADEKQGIHRWLAGIRAGEPTADWSAWVREFSAAFTAWHAGTRGWTDPAFIEPIRAWLSRHSAPPAVRAAVDFRDLLARRQYAAAAPVARILVSEAAEKRYWMDPDLMREGAVLAFLAAGDQAAAQAAMVALAGAARLGMADVRVRLLAAYADWLPETRTPAAARP